MGLGIGGGALGGLSACGSDGDGTRGTDDVTYQLSWTHSVQFGGTYLAQQQGFFEKLGLAVTLAAGGPNVAGDTNTVSGQSLMNISGGDGVARSNAEGADLVIVGAQYQRAANTILSLGESALEVPEDLAGKQIGVAGGNVPALDAFLAINGIAKDSVEYVPSQYDPATLTAGQVDGLFCFYNDLPVALRVQGVDAHSMLLADFGYNPMSQVYTVRRDSLEDETRRAQILDLIRGDAQGWELYREDPESAADLVVEQYPDAGLDLETQREQARVQLDIMYSDATDENGFGWFTDEQVQESLELFGLLGIEGASESLWDRSLLEEIYAERSSA